MVHSILVTGGVASGKSRWAITHLAQYDSVLYLCTNDSVNPHTFGRISYDTDVNGVGWEIETDVTREPRSYVDNHSFVIFDSLNDYTLKALQIADDCSDDTCRNLQKAIVADIEALQQHVASRGGQLIVTTVDVGFSLPPEDTFQAAYRGLLGSVNQRIANIFDEVYLSVSGIQYQIKGSHFYG